MFEFISLRKQEKIIKQNYAITPLSSGLSAMEGCWNLYAGVYICSSVIWVWDKFISTQHFGPQRLSIQIFFITSHKYFLLCENWNLLRKIRSASKYRNISASFFTYNLSLLCVIEKKNYLNGRKRVLYRRAPSVHCTSFPSIICTVVRPP